MRNGIHFIAGLPRSGSTLLSALLLQNPKLHAGVASPLGSLMGAVLREVSQINETSVFLDDSQRVAVLRALFDAIYQDIHPHRTVFDTNRVWAVRLNLLAALFPEAKLICCVRDMSWVIDSVERLIRQNRWELSRIFDYDPAGTVYSRVDGLVSRNGMVGFAYSAVKQVLHSEESDRVMLLTYETLTQDPATAMEAVYDFTGLKPFKHNFNQVYFDAREFDARLGTPGLHEVHRIVRPPERQTVLPPDLWRRFEAENFWRDPGFNSKGVRVV